MTDYILKNKELSLSVNSFGAELTRISDIKTDTDYLWHGDPAYWKRHSPVLFPIVGSLKNNSYHYNGIEYSLSQHGFARDMDFTLMNRSDSEIWFRLKSSDETKKVYPFDFTLEIGYRLIERQITVLWNVINNGTSEMFFSIGAHPAFLCPLKDTENQSDYYISLDNKENLHYLLINNKGMVVKKPFKEQAILETENGFLKINPHLFDQDALIIENNQCQTVSLADSKKNPYVTVHFDAPLFGLWSPAGKNAPFICIEPWYGRCDSSDFDGSLEDREWGNHLETGKEFKASYTIDIN
ncbi:aldose 1-epimerase family protein [Anaerocolumna sp. MB42-C2]|uniref:aldose 1-epimerase family protein n=1 Tax=Anaerocolumna sp. MB42-C2 TaxID=3070997 RepID=UPI0027E021AE|nr:aldose 1-epimerase family protein [Anaerocolumna sp. MB42-C2]WMJ88714.1 aldose 1-epimerase family protein [Anaerocolumna sp. MB42-C2]